MKMNLRRILAACALTFPLVACGSHDVFLAINKGASSGTIVPSSQFSVLKKAATLESFICENIYPVPPSELDCHERMEKAMEKAFPLGLEKAETMGFARVPAQFETTDPVGIVLWRLNARIFGECRSDANFAECMDGAYHALLQGFDPNSAYLNAEEFAEMRTSLSGEFFGVGMEIRKDVPKDPLIVVSPIEGSPAKKAGILPGDVIIRVKDESVDQDASQWKTASDAVKVIRGPKGSSVTLTIERKGEPKPIEVTIIRDAIKTEFVKGELLKDGDATYALIKVSSFGGKVSSRVEAVYAKLEKEARSENNRKLNGLILSLENNLGGLLNEACRMVDLFLDAESIVLMRDRKGVEPHDCWNKEIRPYPGDMTKGLPILVMVNGGSASASEVVAAALQHFKRATVGGTDTFGKGSVQTIMQFDKGSALKLTTSEYGVGLKSDQTFVQCLGVKPDVVFDRGLDLMDKDGKRITDCGRDRHILSGGPQANAPVHTPIAVANPAHYARNLKMLERYKKHVAKEDAERKTTIERLKQQGKDEEGVE